MFYKNLIFLYLVTQFHSSTSNAIDPESLEKKSDTTEVASVAPFYYNAPIIVAAAAAVMLTSIGLLYLTCSSATAYKICYAMGGCQHTMDSIVDELIGKQLGKARNVRSRNKRSVEYLEPLLQTLAKAYEEYGDQDGKKNFKIPSYFTK